MLAALNFEEADRVPIFERLWLATIMRWYDEGLSRDTVPADFFDYDIFRIRPDTSPRFPVQVLDDRDDYVIETTPYGGKVRFFKDLSSTPEILDYPCKSRADWESIKERLVSSRDRYDWGGSEVEEIPTDFFAPMSAGTRNSLSFQLQFGRRDFQGYLEAREKGRCVVYDAIVGYDKIQSYVASEKLLIAIATEPDWVRDMYQTDVNLVIETCEMMIQGGIKFDAAYVLSDLAYRNGLLFSPRHFEEQLHPSFQKLFNYFNSNNMPVILHTDGDVLKLIPYFIEEGVRCLGELEVKAGMDLVALKQEYGNKLAFMGGIDARCMSLDDPRIIEEEIRKKVPVAKHGGGYIFHSDHSIPPNVSLSKYKRVLKLAKQYGAY